MMTKAPARPAGMGGYTARSRGQLRLRATLAVLGWWLWGLALVWSASGVVLRIVVWLALSGWPEHPGAAAGHSAGDYARGC